MEYAMKSPAPQACPDGRAAFRTDSYVMLASLLMQPPSQELMEILRTLEWDGVILVTLENALEALRHAGNTYPPGAVEEEFNRLFVGLGSGEVVPYASWYREKRLQAMPLASLRSDLIALGIVRQAETHESEDHAGVLCEIMALVSEDPAGVPRAAQAGFFKRHLAPWMKTFFRDLGAARSADFYRTVALFGACFLEWESEYLKIR